MLEQYKIIVNSVENLGDRRSNVNSFFLTANTLLVSFVGALSALHFAAVVADPLMIVVASAAGLLLCYEWREMIISYAQLSKGKFTIIHLIENKLPLSLFKAEWKALKDGADPSVYKPLTTVEGSVPVVFASLYCILSVAAVLVASGLA